MRTTKQKIMDHAVNGFSSAFFVASMLGALEVPRYLAEGDNYNCHDGMFFMFCSDSENETSIRTGAEYTIEP